MQKTYNQQYPWRDVELEQYGEQKSRKDERKRSQQGDFALKF